MSKQAKKEMSEPSAVMERLNWQLAWRDDGRVAQALYAGEIGNWDQLRFEVHCCPSRSPQSQSQRHENAEQRTASNSSSNPWTVICSCRCMACKRSGVRIPIAPHEKPGQDGLYGRRTGLQDRLTVI